MQEYKVAMQSWASFAEGKNDIFKNTLLMQIASKYNKSVAQIILRWLIQRNIIVIPKTTSKERMKENFAVFDFVLSEQDMQSIATLDTQKGLFINHSDPNIVKWLCEVHKDSFKS